MPRILLWILALFVFHPWGLKSAYADPVTVTLDDVVKKVSSENLYIYQNALRVYQSREAIQVARGNLLPRLNLWRIAGVVLDPTSIVGVIQDVAPFLVPANWFRLEQARILYWADQEGYRALWANELMTAKAIYVHLLLDQSLLEHVEQSKIELERLLSVVRVRETLGGAPQGASRDIEVRLLALQEDKRSLEVLIAEEESSLSYAMAFPAQTQVRPASIEIPDFETFEPLNADVFEFRVIDSSPELRQYDHFIHAADYVRTEVMYSFLGSASQSRGLSGGVFDNLPTQDGLGFGTPASMRIVSAQKEILRAQRQGVLETLRRRLRLLVNSYNLDLENYSNLKRRVELTRATNDQLYERIRMGETIPALDLIEASRNHIQADTSFFAIKFRLLTNEDKLYRLIFQGSYTKEPIVIEQLRPRR